MEQDQSDKQQSFKHATAQNSKQDEQRGIDDAGGGGGGGGSGGGGEERREVESSIGAEMRNAAQSENRGTAASGHVVECDLLFNSGQQLSEVPVEYVLEPLEAAKGIKDQVRINHHRTLINIPGQAAQVETPNRLQSPDGPSSSELSPTSVTQSISSIPSPTRQEQKLPPVENRVLACVPEIERQNSLNQKSLSVVPVLKKPSHDGYNWRKYGQKQVKSPQGSRSYYRCTYSDCYAKKIECSDHTSRVIEIVYKSQHNHDPPGKVSSLPESRPALSANPVNGLNSTAHSVTPPNDSVPSTSLKDAVKEMAPVTETKEQRAGGSDDDSETNVKEEDIDEPEARKRQKKSSSDCSGTPSKPGKKPKFVVHAAGDVGISGDGYRWRKYGQKMVKGNPHPRNYYRCTSAGCPVRKHIERAVDDTHAVVITYKGIHDHDMPVPKKRQGLPNAPLVAASAPASMSNSEVKKSDQLQNRISTTKWSVDNKGELTGETLEPGGENAIESAKTLLSIGFEIKPC